MSSLTASIVVVAAVSAGPQDVVLLDFTSDVCAPCRTMAPVIDQLEREGYPVRRIDVNRQPSLAQEYEVRMVPTFVLVSGKKELGRLVGIQRYDQMVSFVRQAANPPAAAGPLVRGQSPDGLGETRSSQPRQPEAPSQRRLPPWAGNPPQGMAGRAIPERETRGDTRGSVELRALAATVRLTVEEVDGYSHGTGTIVDVRGPDALIVTCGHLFRESQGRAPIKIDVFAGGAKRTVAGRLLAYEARDRDIALVVCEPGIPVAAMRIAGEDHEFRVGEPVFSIGCDQGADPTVRRSQLTAVNRYSNAPNLEIQGSPIDGRSGGGLFTADGLLIGICNAADLQENKGLFASLPTIHWQLAQVGLDSVYKNAAPLAQKDPTPGLDRNSRPQVDSTLNSPSPEMPLDMAGDENVAGGQAYCVLTEVGADGTPRVIMIKDLSPELLERLKREAGDPRIASGQDRGPIVRAQSQR